jgi:hypothetical protein
VRSSDRSHRSLTTVVVLLLCVLATLTGCAVKRTGPAATDQLVPLPPLSRDTSTNSTTLTNGSEAMYDLVNSGNLATANELLRDVWELPRFAPATLPETLNWHEDPYKDTFWRYQFYSLRPTSTLLWAYYTTHESAYLNKLLSILRSFTTYDATGPAFDRSRLDNPHSAAFRAMILINDYVKLQRSGVLVPDLGAAMKISIIKIGVFLAQSRNYQGTYNHGFTEAAALLLIAVNFPSQPQSAAWRQLSLNRLSTLMQDTVGADGVQIERSPFYHFYVFDFALQLQAWAARSSVELPTDFGPKVAAMVKYSTQIIWPDGNIPLIGSSVRLRPSGYSALYADLEAADPQFAFAVSGGAKGTPLTDRALLFSVSGQAILRSPIDATLPYADNAQLVLNGGPVSTLHSHLDALAFTYYSYGRVLLPDSGLDTYAAGTTYDYFHGTSAHNTVLVDGVSQGPGPVAANLVTSGPGWAYASATAKVYAGVEQERSVVMLGHDLVLVVDSATSATTHDYQQLWHLQPGANLTMDGLTARVTSEQDQPLLQIVQATAAAPITTQTYYGQSSPLQGWYSAAYGNVEKNHVVGYEQHGSTVSYLTLIATGPDAARAASVSGTSTQGGTTVQVCASGRSTTVTITNQGTPTEQVDVQSGTGRCGNGN